MNYSEALLSYPSTRRTKQVERYLNFPLLGRSKQIRFQLLSSVQMSPRNHLPPMVQNWPNESSDATLIPLERVVILTSDADEPSPGFLFLATSCLSSRGTFIGGLFTALQKRLSKEKLPCLFLKATLPRFCAITVKFQVISEKR